MTSHPAPDDPEAFLRELQRRYFPAFLDRAWPHMCGGQLLASNWHVDAIACQLERVESGEVRRLIVNVPPRNGKTNIISIAWVAWMLGVDPTRNFVCVSYSNELSAKFARDCLSIMQSDWYRELFPATIISSRRSAVHDFETTRGGGRLSTSVGGTLTGRGGDIIVLDDVIKPEDAASETVREAVNEWYRSTLVSRLNDKATGAIVCVMQRLHQYDLTGMLLEAASWEHLALPAIATEDVAIPLTRGRIHYRKAGDVLHPEREDLAALEELRIAMGSGPFAAQFQQEPVPATGNLFKAEWLQVWPDNCDPRSSGMVVQSWDTANKPGEGRAYSVCVTAIVQGKYINVIDVWRGRIGYPDLRQKAIDLARLHGVQVLLVEDKASGQQLIQTLLSENNHGVPDPIKRTPQGDKFFRAEGVSAIVEAGNVLLPREAHWLGEFKSELLAFPNGRYDDQVDAFAQLLDWVRSRWSWSQPLNAGPELWCEGDSLLDIDYDGDPWGA